MSDEYARMLRDLADQDARMTRQLVAVAWLMIAVAVVMVVVRPDRSVSIGALAMVGSAGHGLGKLAGIRDEIRRRKL